MSSVIYILSDNRSGSTLLDQLLGGHPDVVSLGEVHHLVAYVLKDRTLYDPVHELVCSCGKDIPACPFWSSVARRLHTPVSELRLKPRFLDVALDEKHSVSSLSARQLRKLVNRHPKLFSTRIASYVFDKRRVARDSFDLLDGVLAESGARYAVDSSKSPFRFRTLYEHSPSRTFAILLARDYRGTVFSKMKRGRDMLNSARVWAEKLRRMQAVTADLPRDRLRRLRYEDLCRDPRSSLMGICEMLDLEYSDSLLSRPSEDVHHIGGSPSKLDPARRHIRIDTSFLDAFTPEQLARMKEIVGDVADDWGYD